MEEENNGEGEHSLELSFLKDSDLYLYSNLEKSNIRKLPATLTYQHTKALQRMLESQQQ